MFSVKKLGSNGYSTKRIAPWGHCKVQRSFNFMCLNFMFPTTSTFFWLKKRWGRGQLRGWPHSSVGQVLYKEPKHSIVDQGSRNIVDHWLEKLPGLAHPMGWGTGRKRTVSWPSHIMRQEGRGGGGAHKSSVIQKNGTCNKCQLKWILSSPSFLSLT